MFQWYGPAVNINPAIFNLMVAVYERLEETGVELSGEAFLEFQGSYEHEELAGVSHRVDGRLYTPAGNVDQLLAEIIETEGLATE